MLEFAIIILLNRRKQAINNNSTGDVASVNQYENALALRLIKTKKMPVVDAYQPETRNVGINDNNGNRSQGAARMKKFIAFVIFKHVYICIHQLIHPNGVLEDLILFKFLINLLKHIVTENSISNIVY